MLRQGINQLFLFGVYDHLKMAIYGLERDAAISSHQALILVCKLADYFLCCRVSLQALWDR